MNVRRVLTTILATFVAISVAVLGVATSRAGDGSPNLLADGAFDDGQTGWTPGGTAKGVSMDMSRDGGRGATGCLHVRASPGAERGPWIWWGSVGAPPTDSALKISGWIRGKGVRDLAAICVKALAPDSTPVAFATTPQRPPLNGDFDWTYVKTVLPATPGLGDLQVLAFLVGDGEAWFDDLRVERTDEKPVAGTFSTYEKSAPSSRPPSLRPTPPPPVPGLMTAMGRFDFVAEASVETPRVLVPLPLAYREQVPITYEMRTDPDGGLTGTRVYEDRPGNWVVEATFRSMTAGEKIHVSWTSLVLCGERSFADLPAKAAVPEKWPDEATPWLRPTRCVQSADPRFVAIGADLRKGTDDVREIVRRVLTRAREVYAAAKGRVVELTALDALDRPGSCTSNANLVAALLRASGVPARVLSGYPLWSGPLQTHYIVEAYVPGYGWYPIESTMLRESWQPYQQVEVSIVPTEHEDASQDRRNVMGGVPRLSLNEIDGDDCWRTGTVDGAPGCDHLAELWRPLPAKGAAAEWASALDAARKRWSDWLPHAKLDEKGRLATALQPEAVTATTAAELAKQLSR